MRDHRHQRAARPGNRPALNPQGELIICTFDILSMRGTGMSDLKVKDLRKAFGSHGSIVAVDDVSLEVPHAEMLVLVGPSGCGKSTTLRCLAGLENPDAGVIEFGDQTIFDAERRVAVPIHRRDIGLVFQNYALWPHMTGWDNIAFPLKSRRIPREERKKKIAAIAEVVDLDGRLLDKRPAQLSGGQQQRVALARALVAEPKIVMFDEPLSNLDAALREQLRSEIRRLHEQIRFTGVYVTHDLTEAMLLGDRVAAMTDGAIVQLGRPDELFASPATSRIARMMGYRRLCSITGRDDRWSGTDCEFAGPVPHEFDKGKSYELFTRPEHISISPVDIDNGSPSDHEYRVGGGIVAGVGYLGGEQELTVEFRGRNLRLVMPLGQIFVPGDRVDLITRVSETRIFPLAEQANAHTDRETDL
ncbi:ABC transporter ATP-binding protein [Rhodococcus sp. IEGM 1307]|uniref:ABC transporter ATP-binding protein n=1 Tax=Rhodococcus sp. IEGM 1307 TaxID=3047091 RepID=UPI0024B6E346|nr:ABC transporter ATP-binding protein [Rhodococcus sp. IEGM 1307]MDI9979600.1 ABC transporter ATP-binding protein [Rhodococcus sp. IEGM 1307]